MNLSLKTALITSVAIAAIAYGLGRYASPVKTIEVEKIVEKEVKEEDHSVIVTKRPDGTVVHEFLDKSRESRERVKESTKVVDNKKPDWFLAGGYGANKPAYSLEVNRRVLGAVFAGGQVLHIPDKETIALIKVGYEF
jgi:hypothetical protein